MAFWYCLTTLLYAFCPCFIISSHFCTVIESCSCFLRELIWDWREAIVCAWVGLSLYITLSLVIVFHILAKLSKQFGSVLKMPPYYKGYYLAEILGGIAFVTHLWQASLLLSQPTSTTHPFETTLWLYHLPLALAVTIALIITWKYWGWLFIEKEP